MIEETPQEARQGRKDKPVALVLLASLALGLVALIALYLWAVSGDEPGPEPGELENQSRLVRERVVPA